MSNAQMGTSIAIIGVVSVCIYTAISMISDYLFKKNQNWRLSRIFIVTASMILGALSLVSIIVFQNPIWIIVALCLSKGLSFVILPIGPTIMINEMRELGGLMASILNATGSIAGIIAPIFTGFIISLAGGNKIVGYNNTILVMAALVLLFGIPFGILFGIFTNQLY